MSSTAENMNGKILAAKYFGSIVFKVKNLVVGVVSVFYNEDSSDYATYFYNCHPKHLRDSTSRPI
jgi:hypothetical protein